MHFFRPFTTWLLAVLLSAGSTSGVIWAVETNISVLIPNTPTTVDANGLALGTGYTTTFIEGQPAVGIVDAAALTVSDPDQLTVNSALITLTNPLDGLSEAMGVTTPVGLTASYNAGTGVLTISGVATLATYQTTLRTLTYNNVSLNPNPTTRVVNIAIDDGFGAGPAAVSTINIVAIENTPIADLNGAAGGINTTAIFQEGAGAVFITQPSATVTDADNVNLIGMTISLTNVLDGTNELISATLSGGVTGSYDPGSGIMALSGVASLATYQNIVRSLTYNNSSTNPTATARVINVTVSDGVNISPIATSTITITPVNNAPTINALANQSVLEDSAVLSIPLSGIGNGGDAAQILSVSATSSDTALVLNPTVIYTSPNASGTLLLAPVPNQFGSATISVTVRDDGGTAQGGTDVVTRTFVLTVQAVNDRPTLAVLSDMTLNENDPAYVFGISGISVGPTNENGQAITLSAVSSRPDIIPHPTITYASPQSFGALTMTPALNTSGTATIVLTARDNGGTALGGSDTFSRSFTVTVLPIIHQPIITTNAGLTVPVGGSGVISYLNLLVSDNLDPDQLVYTLSSIPSAGLLKKDGVNLSSGSTFTQGDIDAGLLLYTHTGPIATTDNFTFTVANSEGNTLPLTTFAITVTGSSTTTIPVVTMPNGGTVWTQGGGPVVLDGTATANDSSGTLSGGTLSVSIIENGAVDDVLGIRHVGNGAGQIGVSGVQVSYSGSIIGTITGTSPLSIVLSGPATPAAVQALLRQVTFTSTAIAPTTDTRRVQVVLSNGTGGISSPVISDVSMVVFNQAPIVQLPAVSVAYVEASGALVLDNSAVFTDIDSAMLGGGNISASWTNGTSDDQLWIRNEGTGANQISVTGNAVSYNGSIIGFLSGGQFGLPLNVQFTELATPAAAQATLRNMTFTNDSPLPSLTPRQLVVVGTDGDGGTSAPANLTVIIQGTENAPVVTLPSAPTIYLQEAGPVAFDPAATISDVDSSAFDAGVLAVDFTSGATSADRLLIHGNGSGVGQIDVVGTQVRFGGTVIGSVTGPGTASNPLLILLNSQATVAATQALLRRIAFQNDAVPPTNGVRVMRVILNDGSGATSTPVTTSITVQAVNAPPVVSLPGPVVTWIEGSAPITIAASATVTDVDSPILDGGSMVVTVTNSTGGELLSLRSDGNGAGQIGVSGSDVNYGGVVIGTLSGSAGSTLTVQLNSAATPAAVEAMLRAVQFSRSGQLPADTTRAIDVVVNDGEDPSVAASTSVNLQTVNDPPTANPVMLITVSDITAEGTLSGSDPEGSGLTWELVTAPATGSATVNSNGRVSYAPDPNASGDVTFTARASDGVSWSAPATVTARITERNATVRPRIISAPPREGFLQTPLNYQITAELGGLPSGTNLQFQAVGVPVGATVTVTKTSATSATVVWTATGVPQQHQQIGLLVYDLVTGISTYQPIQIVWSPAGGGAG
jgi:Cadherin-like/Bacterial Ig domain